MTKKRPARESSTDAPLKPFEGFSWPLQYRENTTDLMIGMGDRFDESKMGIFPTGSFAYLDPDMHHYAMASGEVVVQVHGKAPLQFNYVNPNDDPSRRK